MSGWASVSGGEKQVLTRSTHLGITILVEDLGMDEKRAELESLEPFTILGQAK